MSMTENENCSIISENNAIEPEFQGIYGRYRITVKDQMEVKLYRISVLLCGISFCAGLVQWIVLGANWAWIWLLPMAISLGLALQWIHIYLRPIQISLQLLWALGCCGIGVLLWKLGAERFLPNLVNQRELTFVIGPFFAALTGLGFKEFFCFRRPEAIGLTLLLPISLIGHITGIMNEIFIMIFLFLSGVMLLLLSIRKFGMEASSDIGDKSVFNYLKNQKIATNL